MGKKQGFAGSPRTGRGILLLLAGTLVPLVGSALSALLAPAAAGAVSLTGYLLTVAGGALLLPDSLWFVFTVLFSILGMMVDSLPFWYGNVSGEALYVLTAVVAALCYAAIYMGLDCLLARVGAPADDRGLGLWWIMLFAMGEVFMFLSMYVQPRMHVSGLTQLLGTLGAFACAVCALVFQVRYLLLTRKRLS
ncbi:MAG: hypothetical protein AB7C89_03815 [Intestinibacillus sp.]